MTPAAIAAPAPMPAPAAPTAVSARQSMAVDALRLALLCALSTAMLVWIFPAYGVWPLVFVGLVPWVVGVCGTSRAYLAHWFSLLAGAAFFLVALRWLLPVTGAGYAALSVYLAIYWTLAAWGVRTARRHGIGAVWGVPVVWVACEYLRGVVMTGLPWLFIGHSLYAQLGLIQICDLTGVYGVSFVAAMVNGAIADLVLRRWPGAARVLSARQAAIGVIAAVVVVASTIAYGVVRLRLANFENNPAARGPAIAVIQEDFPLVSTPPYGEHQFVVMARYLALGAQAAAQRPDLVVFPETVWGAKQNIGFVERERSAVDREHADTWMWGTLSHEAVGAFARGDYAAVNKVLDRLQVFLKDKQLRRLPEGGGPPVNVLVGSVALDQFPENAYPRVKQYNSALLYDRNGLQSPIRYDKRHLVPFGEFVPFRQSTFIGVDLHYWLYRPLNALSPFSQGGKIEYSLYRGKDYTVFSLPGYDGPGRFGTPICFESTIASVVRGHCWDGPRRRVDFIVNISNDGWFLHSNELPQHLAINVFRAVENRVTIARAVNTGISGFIDPNGRIYSRVLDADGQALELHERGVVGYDIENVFIDRRASIYGAYGDWFAAACVLAAAALWASAVVERWVLAVRARALGWLRARS